MHRQTANPRRATSRSRNDENALPITSNAGVMRSKTSMSHLGPAQRAAGVPAGAGVVGAKKGAAVTVKAGAKRTALGGVVGNGVKGEEVMDNKPCELRGSSAIWAWAWTKWTVVVDVGFLRSGQGTSFEFNWSRLGLRLVEMVFVLIRTQ
jgi:hypothetical protein